jgi:hypothetical protein
MNRYRLDIGNDSIVESEEHMTRKNRSHDQNPLGSHVSAYNLHSSKQALGELMLHTLNPVIFLNSSFWSSSEEL